MGLKYGAMKRHGKANWVIIASLVSVLVLVAVLVSASKGPGGAATEFMTGLSYADAAKLARVSAIGQDDEATRRAKWQQTLARGKHYLFVWKMLETVNTGKDRAVAKVLIVRNATLPNAFDEKVEIPLVKKDEGWKVDVAGINREIFPALPTLRPLNP